MGLCVFRAWLRLRTFLFGRDIMKRILCVIVCAIILVAQSGCTSAEINVKNKTSSVQQVTQRTTNPTTAKSHKEVYVYITYTGTKYHEYYCGCLWNSCIEILLEDAARDGYTPCKRCQPPMP